MKKKNAQKDSHLGHQRQSQPEGMVFSFLFFSFLFFSFKWGMSQIYNNSTADFQQFSLSNF